MEKRKKEQKKRCRIEMIATKTAAANREKNCIAHNLNEHKRHF